MPSNVHTDWNRIRNRAAKFSAKYKDAEREVAKKQLFWTDFLSIFGIDASKIGEFEYPIETDGGHQKSIDYLWPGKLLIEHKSAGVNLDKALEQAKEYLGLIEAHNERAEKSEEISLPTHIIVSDFKRIRLYHTVMGDKICDIKLGDLATKIEKFGFLIGKERVFEEQPKVDTEAAAIMGELYDMLMEANYPQEKVDVLLIRLVFLLFAEDSEIFLKGQVADYIHSNTRSDGTDMGVFLSDLFDTLNKRAEERESTTPPDLMAFPYVNGGLFAERIPIPHFNREMRNCFLKASELDWRYISPAIFGSLFQSVMNPEERRTMGAHYTSEENILKLINPLFMDGLRAELKHVKNDRNKIQSFRQKLSRIKILDPACGCGNFLTIAYREIRRLEIEAMEASLKIVKRKYRRYIHSPKETYGSFDTPTLIFIDHFYGIEIAKFPSMIARLSIILMDHLTNIESRDRLQMNRSIIPLKEKANIIQADSLDCDWEDVVKPDELTYIIGNPPFVGARYKEPEQQEQMKRYFKKNAGVMDYVSAWYVKAYWMMKKNREIRTGFVSTNSITQGQQVSPLWKPLFDDGIVINFAYRTFKWTNEAKGVAAVHVVIIGFSLDGSTERAIYVHSNGLTGDVKKKIVSHINPYLVDDRDIFVEERRKPICDVPMMKIGNKPVDGGNYLFSKEEMEDFIKKEPRSEKYFIQYVGATEFTNKKERFCLWLGNCEPSEIRSMPECMKRVEAVRQFRLSRKSAETRKIADKPTRFHVENMPEGNSIVIPKTSTGNRNYIPIGILPPSVMCSDALILMHKGELYHLGVLSSKMHMVWIEYVGGSMKSDFRYSVDIVYNNFPWPEPNEKQKSDIEKAAQNILDVRNRYPNQSYADLYNPLVMPVDLLKAHHRLDKAVEAAYSDTPFKDDNERTKFLFDRYEEIVNGK